MGVPSRNPADIRAVAKRAGVSIATVSRVLNGVPTVDRTLAAKVKRAAAYLNYSPNPQARSLVSGRSGMIGLVVSEITNPFFPELIQAFEEAAVARGYEILLCSTSYSEDRMLQTVRRMLERKVDGVAVMTFGMDDPMLKRIAASGVPVASVRRASSEPGVSAIEIDFLRGIQQAVQHLADLGHSEIAFIRGPKNTETADLRQKAFLRAMKASGLSISPKLIQDGDHTMEGGLRGAEALLNIARPPTAILCSNDMTAIGVLHSVAEHGYRVPQDISVIGFDDIHMAQFTVPPLSSVRMASTELATSALRALLAEQKSPGAKFEPVSTSLVLRETTAKPRALAKLTPKKKR